MVQKGIRRGGCRHAHCRKDQHRADNEYRQVVTKPASKRPCALDAPDPIKAFLDLLQHRDCRVEQQQDAEETQHPDTDVLHKPDDGFGELD